MFNLMWLLSLRLRFNDEFVSMGLNNNSRLLRLNNFTRLIDSRPRHALVLNEAFRMRSYCIYRDDHFRLIHFVGFAGFVERYQFVAKKKN